jgi:peptidoglycan/LPS O-acetylase OafA/YrhL
MFDKYQTRLLGIDLCRGIAAYAVVLVHSGDEAWGLPISQAAIQFRLLFYFAVPFFLAVAFHFLTRKPTIDISAKFWRSRIQRIVIPYAIWSVIYLVVRSLFFLIAHKSDRLAGLFQDPLAIIFFGSASFQLYFLPLLLAGTALLLMVKYLTERKISSLALAALMLLSIEIYEMIHATGNDFQLGEGVAFNSILQQIPNGVRYSIARIIFVEFAWIIRCMPYAFGALLLHRFLNRLDSSQVRSRSLAVIFIALFLMTTTIGKFCLPPALQEVLVAYFLLIAGILGSISLKDNQLVASLGACSFGIYLVHPIPMNIVKGLMVKVFPALSQQVSITSMLTLSISSFLLSWLIVSLLSKNKTISKYTFGS